MAFRLRRGTDLQRQSITPAEGELIYVTDTKEIYAGDGTTLGGILVTGDVAGSPPALTRDLDTDGFTISGNGTIDLSGTITATSFVGDGSGLTGISSSGAGIIEGQDYVIGIQGDVKGSDSSIIVDSSTNSIYGNFIGDGSQITDLSLNQLDDVATFSPGEGEILKYISGFWTNAPDGNAGAGLIEGQCYPISIQGDIVSVDSSVIVDATNNTFYGTFVGDGSGLTGISGRGVTEGQTYDINITGDVIADDSTTMVNTAAKTFTGYLIGDVGGDLEGDVLALDVVTNTLTARNTNIDIYGTDAGEVNVAIRTDENRSNLKLFRESTTTVSGDVQYGTVIFGRNDTSGEIGTGLVTGTRDYIYIAQNPNGVGLTASNYLSWNGENFGVGTFAGTAKIEVKDGSIRLNDTRTLASISSPLAGEIKYESADSSIYYNNGTDWFQTVALNTSTGRASIDDASIVFNDSRAYTDITPENAGELMFDGTTGDGDFYFYAGSEWCKVIHSQVSTGATLIPTPVIIGNVDEATRDGFGADSSTIDGAILYNTDEDRVQVFQAGSWVSIPNNGSEAGQVLTWDGTKWEATAPATGGSVVSADQLDGFDGPYYLDYNNFTNTPTISAFGATLIDDADAATARTTLGLGTAATTAATAYATSAQGALADTAVQPADLGNFTFTSSVLDTSDSSGITVTPAVTVSSDLTVENNLTVTNKIVADTIEVNNIITTPGDGTPEIESSGAILLTAGTRVEVTQSPFKMASFTTSERDALSSENGDMIYNTTTNKFQGYANGTWVDLH